MPIELVDRDKITRLREALGLSVQDAAEQAGITRQQWNNIENGTTDNPKLQTLDAMARVLKKKVKDLLK